MKSFHNLNYYREAIKNNRRVVALLIAASITIPLFVFTALPPIEIETEIERESEVEITTPIVVETPVQVNLSAGDPVFLSSQPPPSLIDSDIVICVDESGSMGLGGKMDITKAAILRLLNLLNQTNRIILSNGEYLVKDRVALTSFQTAINDYNWLDDAEIDTELNFVSNNSHLENISLEVQSLGTNGGTDIWAGLNKSLEVLLNENNQRNVPTLKSIILLTDGEHQSGPWGNEVDNKVANYIELFSQNDSTDDNPLYIYSQSPIKVARENGVKIYSVGIRGDTPDYDADFLRGISLNKTFGANGDFFWGNDTLSLSESFLKAKDGASGWAELEYKNDTVITANGSQEIFSLNVNSSIRKLKYDLNWNDTSVSFNLSVGQPNGSIFTIPPGGEEIPKNVIIISDQLPKSIVIDFPTNGTWQFNITAAGVPVSGELIKARISSYNPPIFIESVTELKEGESPVEAKILYTIGNVKNGTNSVNNSVYFELNVTNKNPLFSFHNITPSLIGLVHENVTYTWTPSVVENLSIKQTVSFVLNITLLNPVLFEGDLNFRVDCDEGYFDAYKQPAAFGFSEETRYESTFITTQIVETSKVLEYIPLTEEFNTLKWIGLIITLIILVSFSGVYIKAQQVRIRNLAVKFRSRLFPDQSVLSEALQREGIVVSPAQMDTIMVEAGDLDRLGKAIYDLTGKRLSTDELIRIASGTNVEKIAQRISFTTGIAVEEVLSQLHEAQSIDELIQQLNLDKERFLDIIARDEDVMDFQSKVKGLIVPKLRVSSGIITNEDLDVIKFRSRLKKVYRPK
ncbi:MAG: VWA domain-containing protein [Candidatus Heimdallarchaeota archaeon]